MNWISKVVVCLSVFFTHCLYSIDVGVLKKRISSNKHPKWMKEAVSHALEEIADAKISSKAIGQMYESFQLNEKRFVRFQIQNKKLKCFCEFQDPTGRYNVVRKAIRLLHKEIGLPDLDIIVCIGDSFEGKFGIPVFAFAKDKSVKHTVLIPDIEALRGYKETKDIITEAVSKHPWSKKIEKAYFRGTTTGGHFDQWNWDKYPRTMVALMSLDYPDELDAKITKLGQGAELIADLFKQSNIFGNRISVADHLQFKYLLDVDGNSCTYPRCFWILYSNSVLFKVASQNIQWFYEAMKPYVHYIPVESDFSDLVEQVYWARDHDDQVKAIAAHATKFAKKDLSPESIYEYLFLLLKKFAKLQRLEKKV